MSSSRTYRNPPVHEVILDVQMHEPVERESLTRVAHLLAPKLGHATPVEEFQVGFKFSPSGAQEVRTTRGESEAWRLERQDAGRWVGLLTPTSVTLHFVRSAEWPSGTYVGWNAIFEEFQSVQACVMKHLPTWTPRRAGLRYINRLAIPVEDDIRHWCNLWLSAPSVLAETYSFDHKHTWERVVGFDGLSSTIRFARIQIDNPALAKDHRGYLLDIDVYNLLVKSAPALSGVADWFVRAHEAENAVFESVISESMRGAMS